MNVQELAAKIRKSILNELSDRSGFDGWWYSIDDEIQEEIEEDIDNIIEKELKEYDAKF